jgi:hypothetical protein
MAAAPPTTPQSALSGSTADRAFAQNANDSSTNRPVAVVVVTSGNAKYSSAIHIEMIATMDDDDDDDDDDACHDDNGAVSRRLAGLLSPFRSSIDDGDASILSKKTLYKYAFDVLMWLSMKTKKTI